MNPKTFFSTSFSKTWFQGVCKVLLVAKAWYLWVFCRYLVLELISNASDALNKIMCLSLTDREILGEGDKTKLEIQGLLGNMRMVLA
ncbi:hypothetical protein P8452_14651 [Trifolium repens]|nr:hypothetical protein P8452_14651 [Trifolium repens]